MFSIDTSPAPVNRMSNERAVNVAARAKRDYAIRRAAQVLADATACRAGEQPIGLSQVPTETRDWFLRTVASLIEIYETTVGIPPIPQVAEPPPAVPLSASGQMQIERSRARMAANDRGHDMGAYRPYAPGIDWSVCRACGQSVVIDVTATPAISGTAIAADCAPAGKDGE